MQIQLKQTEIIQALKLYITTQGINLNGKSVEVSFTAGRRDSGLTADVQIEDLTRNEGEVCAPIPVGPINRDVGYASTAEAAMAESMEVKEFVAAQVMEEEVSVEEEAVAPTKGTSLFG